MKRWLYRPWAVVLTTVLLISVFWKTGGRLLECFCDIVFSFCSRGCWFLRQFFISSGMCLKTGVSGPFV